MILLLGGTSEANGIAKILVERGYPVLLSTATPHGASLAGETGAQIHCGRLDSGQLRRLLDARGIRIVLDASHPFAESVSKNARLACADSSVVYLRFARRQEPLPDFPFIYPVGSYGEAAELSVKLGNTIFLSTGSKTAEIFIAASRTLGKRLIVRVLPDAAVIAKLLESGIKAGDIVAMQGPFGFELNLALFRHYRADVLVTKESGAQGGLKQKLEAAGALQMPVVLIRRPPEPGDALFTPDELLIRIKEIY